MKGLFLFLALVLCTSAFACDDVAGKAVLINSLAWVYGSGPGGMAGGAIRSAIDSRIAQATYYAYDPDDIDRKNTKEQLRLLDKATIVWIFAHCSDFEIALEYHDTQNGARASASNQGIPESEYRLSERNGKWGLNIYGSGLQILWDSLGVEYAEYCGFVIWGCISATMSRHFEFGVPYDGVYAAIGTNRNIYVPADNEIIELFWQRMLCLTSQEEVLDTYYLAAEGDDYGGGIPELEYWDNQDDEGWRYWLAPDPCNQCHKPTCFSCAESTDCLSEVSLAGNAVSVRLQTSGGYSRKLWMS
jgi:hypothetical protein